VQQLLTVRMLCIADFGMKLDAIDWSAAVFDGLIRASPIGYLLLKGRRKDFHFIAMVEPHRCLG